MTPLQENSCGNLFTLSMHQLQPVGAAPSPGKPNLPLGLRGKAGGCARVTAGPKRQTLSVNGWWAPWEALCPDPLAARQRGARLLPSAWPQVWGPPACWGQTQPPVPPGAVGDPSPDFLPLCPSLLTWHHKRCRARCCSAVQSCTHSVLPRSPRN